MRARVMVWLLASVAGAILLALPDQGARLVAFSGAHGLTLLDAAAVAVLLAGWLPVAVLGWRRRKDLIRRVAEPARRVATFVTGLGLGLLVASVFADFEGWWVVGAALLVSVQVAGLLVLTRS